MCDWFLNNVLGGIISGVLTTILIGLYVLRRDNKGLLMNALVEIELNGPGRGKENNPFLLEQNLKLLFANIISKETKEKLIEYIDLINKNAGKIGNTALGHIYSFRDTLKPLLEKELNKYWF